MRILDYHIWVGGKTLRWADDVMDLDEDLFEQA
jgi:hypothetical protein